LANGPAAEQMLSRGDNWNPVLDKKKNRISPRICQRKEEEEEKDRLKSCFFTCP